MRFRTPKRILIHSFIPIAATEQCWPGTDRPRCTLHRLRNVLAKLPERERERVHAAYWQALDDAQSRFDGERRCAR